MKKFLPIFFTLIFVIIGFVFPHNADATHGPIHLDTIPVAPDDSWVIDEEVTFIGKNAARSGNLLNFTLQNYNWVCVTQAPNGQCDNSNNPLAAVWWTSVQFIVAPLLLFVIIVAAGVIIVTRGRSLTITRFIPRFTIVLLFIFLSFSIVQILYQIVDLIQGFFLGSGTNACTSVPGSCISNKDLLFVGWDYDKFIGLRLKGNLNAESAFISLLLTKLTALTYFVMVGILFLRKIILWLFIIVSPIFPLLLLFYPVRNTGKIWIGEFFRWLLYAPLFAIFLKGLVSLWRNQIPLSFTPSDPAVIIDKTILYPTAINILLGGPKQFVTQTNSINLTETFALYVVSLLMLWGVIILPWILLQIFLDYASNLGVGDSAVMKNLVNMVNNRQNPPSPSHPPTTTGSAISLPFTKKFNMPLPPSGSTGKALEIPISTQSKISTSFMPSAQVKAQVLSLANTTLPSMRDIARYDTSLISRDSSRQKDTITLRDNLIKIGNPESSTSTSEKEKYTEIREKLVQESNNGNTLATSILTAANTASKKTTKATTSQIKTMLSQIANPQAASQVGAASVVNREKLSKMNESLIKAKKEGNTLAASILAVTDKTPTAEIEKLQEKIMDAKAKGEPVGVQLAQLTEKKGTIPLVNRVQTVSKEDYQAVKDMWKENYKNLEVPQGMAGSREEWVKDDITKIDNIIGLLSSKDEEKLSQGMEEVSSILPFLLVGGFSQTEIIAYLKAKQDAAREVTVELASEEESKVSIAVKKTTTAQQAMSASIADDSGEDESGGMDLSTAPAKNIIIPQASKVILMMSNLEIPKLTDIVKYEVRTLTKDKTESERVEKMHGVLEKIGNPASVASTTERAQFESLKEKLSEESKKGDPTAGVILAAVSQLTRTVGSMDATLEEIKTVLSQIKNPSANASVDDRDYYKRLHEYLDKEASENGNQLAQKILNVDETTKNEDIQEIHRQLKTAQQKGEPIAQKVLSKVTQYSSLPTVNRLQEVTPEEYEEAKELWKKAYIQYFVPQGYTEDVKGRLEWINNDIKDIEETIDLLGSTDEEKKNTGIKKVSGILPFLLLGGFSFAEMIKYLQTKVEAAKEAIISINEEEDKSVELGVAKTEKPKEMHESQEMENEDKKS